MLRFHKLRFKNLLSYGNSFTEIQLDRSPSTLICGSNGNGKSGGLIEGLSFSLFGKAFRNINKNSLINSINRKELVAEVEFSTGGNEFKIIRGMKPSIFEIYKNGTLVPQPGNVKDYQKLLEETILKFNFKSFTQIVVLGNASYTPFMQLAAKDRRDVIEDLLDIQIFSSMNVLLKDKISKNKNDAKDIKYQMDLTNEKIDIQKKYLEQLKSDNKAQIKSIMDDIEEYRGLSNLLSKEISSEMEAVGSILESISDHKKSKEKYDKIYDILSKLKTKEKKSSAQLRFYSDNEHCPTCEQVIDIEIKTKKIEQTTETIRQTQNAVDQLKTEFSSLKKRLDVIDEKNEEINKKQQSINECQNKITVYQDHIQNLERKIQSIEESSSEDSESRSALEVLTVEYERASNEYKELLEEREILSVGQDLLKDGGIKTQIIRQYVPIINKLVNKYLASLDFFVNFELDEEFNEKIRSRYRDEFTYSSFSEGEKSRINIALLLAWRAVSKLKNSTNTNLLVLDEIMDSSMDVVGIDILMNLFNELEDTNLFVISHRGDTVIDKFRSIIQIEKRKNFSCIV